MKIIYTLRLKRYFLFLFILIVRVGFASNDLLLEKEGKDYKRAEDSQSIMEDENAFFQTLKLEWDKSATFKLHRSLFYKHLKAIQEKIEEFRLPTSILFISDKEDKKQKIGSESLVKDLHLAGLSLDRLLYEDWIIYPNHENKLKFADKIAYAEKVIIIGSPAVKEKYLAQRGVISEQLNILLTRMNQGAEKFILPIWFEGNIYDNFPSCFPSLPARPLQNYFINFFLLLEDILELKNDDNFIIRHKEKFEEECKLPEYALGQHTIKLLLHEDDLIEKDINDLLQDATDMKENEISFPNYENEEEFWEQEIPTKKEEISNYKLKAKNGNPYYQMCVGGYYRLGLYGFPKNSAKAYKYLLAAAEKDNKYSHYLARLLEVGEGIPQNIPLAIQLYRQGAMLNNNYSLLQLGRIYKDGKYGVHQDRKKALELFMAAAEAGSGCAWHILGELYETGYEEVEIDKEAAFRCYKKSVEAGDNCGKYYLAQAYENGCGTKVNIDKALKWYKRAADQEHKLSREAIIKLAQKYDITSQITNAEYYNYLKKSSYHSFYHLVRGHFFIKFYEILYNNITSIFNRFSNYFSYYLPFTRLKSQKIEPTQSLLIELNIDEVKLFRAQTALFEVYLQKLNQILTPFEFTDIIFFSYSWDNEKHKKMVYNLVKNLTSAGLNQENLLYDRWSNKPGTDTLFKFSDNILTAPQVILIGSPEFKKKYELGIGVITQELGMLKKRIEEKGIKGIIPLWFEGTLEENFPEHFHFLAQDSSFKFALNEDYFLSVFNLLSYLIKNENLESTIKTVKDEFCKERNMPLHLMVNYGTKLTLFNQMLVAQNTNAFMKMLEEGEEIFQSLTYRNYDFEKMKEEEEMAVQEHERVAEQEGPDSYMRLGWLYKNGERNIRKDYKKALKYFTKAAEGGDQYKGGLAVLYEEGAGVNQNIPYAVKLYKQAAKAGSPFSASSLGYYYLHGKHGFTKKPKKAFDYFYKASQKAEIYKSMLAYMYENGYGIEKDIKKAVELYKEAAISGEPSSFVMLAWMYQEGEYGFSQDSNKSFYLLHKAASLGNACAWHDIGWRYEKGISPISQNKEIAFKCYKKSAYLNDTCGMWHLGRSYKEGIGIRKNIKQAILWIEKAAKAGHEEAKIEFAKLKLITY